MDSTLILVIVLGMSVVVFIAFAILTPATRAARVVAVEDEDDAPGDPKRTEPDGRPWRARPSSWLLVTALFLFVGLFVTPKIFGGVFFFLPLIWMRGLGRRRPGGPRQRD